MNPSQTVSTQTDRGVFASSGRRVGASLLGLWVLAVVSGVFSPEVAAQGVSEIELQELRAALQVSNKHLAEERRKSAALEETRKALAQSLAEANREATSHRKSHRELLIKMESLGVDVLSQDPASLEQRLLKAVRDRDLERRRTEQMEGQLIHLTESVMTYLAGVPVEQRKGQSSELLEEQLRATESLLVRGQAERGTKAPKALADGRVVSLDPEIGLLVLDVGKDSGLRVGMPVQVLRVERPIGSALVVDVRDRIAGAVLDELLNEGDDVKVGDRILPQPGNL